MKMADFLCSVCRIISGIQDRFEPKPKKRVYSVYDVAISKKSFLFCTLLKKA